MKKYKLTKEEITRQLHQAIQDLYPKDNYDPNLINKMLFESRPGEIVLFPAGDFAELYDINSTEFANRLYTELSVEFEKNLHDKFLFEMTQDNNTIFFTAIKSNSNG